MLPPKNIGIFGEYEEKHEKEMQKLLIQLSLQRYIDTLGDYPDHDDPAAQLILESMLKVVLDQFERVYGDDSPDA
tara:strand:+ start:604 stop:828 length:225 start_codon:yes stop_codon:yes gene_type:complete